MLFTITAEIAKKSEPKVNSTPGEPIKIAIPGDSKESTDLILEKTGRYVKFSNEVSQHVINNRSSDQQFSLHQTVMSIVCDTKTDMTTIAQTVRAVLEKAVIQWNFIGIAPSSGSSPEPAVFGSLKKTAIIKAAKKAGIIPGSMPVVLAGLCGAAIAGYITAGLFRLLLNHEPLSAASILKTMHGAASDQVFTGIAVAAFTLFSICFASLFRNFQTHNRKLQKKIAGAVETISTSRQADAPLIIAIKDQVLALPMPMAIFTSDLNRLDFFSRTVLLSILTSTSDATVGLLLWILCEYDDLHGTGAGSVPKVASHHCYRFVDRQPGIRRN